MPARSAIGTSLAAVTLDQQRASLDPAATLADTLTGGGGDTVVVAGERRHVIGYMKDFLFKPEQARTPVGVLSGGERGRLMLACALARPSNLLVLDEPTNDLDLETLDLLQEMLADYPGTVLLVSHDRDFLDRVVTSTLAAEGGGRWVEYAGGYSDMLAQRGPAGGRAPRRRPGAEAAAAAPCRRPAATPQAVVQGQARAGDAARRDGSASTPRSPGCRPSSPTPTSTAATPPAFQTRPPTRSRGAEHGSCGRRGAWLELEMLREEIGGLMRRSCPAVARPAARCPAAACAPRRAGSARRR